MTTRLRARRAARAARASLGALAIGAAVAGCYRFEPRALGPGGRRVTSVREGAAVDVRFASPRAFRGSPDLARVVRVRGRVDRVSGDTLVVRVESAAPLGSGLREVEPAVRVPVVVSRDTAVSVRELSRTRTALVGLGALVAAIALIAAS